MWQSLQSILRLQRLSRLCCGHRVGTSDADHHSVQGLIQLLHLLQQLNGDGALQHIQLNPSSRRSAAQSIHHLSIHHSRVLIWMDLLDGALAQLSLPNALCEPPSRTTQHCTARIARHCTALHALHLHRCDDLCRHRLTRLLLQSPTQALGLWLHTLAALLPEWAHRIALRLHSCRAPHPPTLGTARQQAAQQQ